MAEAGRSLKSFYLVLGALALVGIGLIIHAAIGHGGPPIVIRDCAQPPLGALTARGPTAGPDSAPVTITEYADFECPMCARVAILTVPDILQRLVPTGKLRWQFLDFPLQQHANSPLAHVTAACAGAQGKFWEMSYAIYQHQDDWFEDRNPEGKFMDYARAVGLNVDSLRVCVDQRRPWPQIEANRCSGEQLGVNGTPTFFVNGHPLPDVPSFDDFARIVDSASKAAAPRAAAARR